MEDFSKDEVINMCNQVTEEIKSKVPHRVVDLIYQILEAVIEEPEKYWEWSGDRVKPKQDSLVKIAREGVIVFKFLLLKLGNQDSNREVISYFEVLHNISDFIETICPLKK